MGERGRIPEREEDRLRRNIPEHPIIKLGPEEFNKLPFKIDLSPEPPPQPDEWHPVANLIWDALQVDPARTWMTSGDWAVAHLMCENVSLEMSEQIVGIVQGGRDADGGIVEPEVLRERRPMKGASLSALLKWLSMTGITEGARRRLNIEITLHAAASKVDTGENVYDIESKRENALRSNRGA